MVDAENEDDAIDKGGRIDGSEFEPIVKNIFGTRSNKEVKKLYPLVEKINQLTDSLKDKSDQE